MSVDMPPDLYRFTVSQVAARLGIAASTVRQKCRRGEIPAEKFGKQYLIPVAWLTRTYGPDG